MFKYGCWTTHKLVMWTWLCKVKKNSIMLFFSPTRWGLVIIPKFTSWLSKHGSVTKSYIFFSCHHIQLLREENIKFNQVSSTSQSFFCCSISCCIKSLCANFSLYLDGFVILVFVPLFGKKCWGCHPSTCNLYFGVTLDTKW